MNIYTYINKYIHNKKLKNIIIYLDYIYKINLQVTGKTDTLFLLFFWFNFLPAHLTTSFFTAKC